MKEVALLLQDQRDIVLGTRETGPANAAARMCSSSKVAIPGGIRRVTEHLPHTGAGDIAEALEHGIESRDAVFHEQPYASAIRLARILDG